MKKIKHTKGAFINLMENNNSYSEPEKLIKNSPLIVSRELYNLTITYNDNFERINDKLRYLVMLEELILQYRSMENLNEIKFSIVKGSFIYARSPFFRLKNSTKDLRIIVGKTEFLGNNISKLEQNKDFIDNAMSNMRKSMKKLIDNTKSELKKYKEFSTNLFKNDNINSFNLNCNNLLN
jgi:hypothetical protein